MTKDGPVVVTENPEPSSLFPDLAQAAAALDVNATRALIFNYDLLETQALETHCLAAAWVIGKRTIRDQTIEATTIPPGEPEQVETWLDAHTVMRREVLEKKNTWIQCAACGGQKKVTCPKCGGLGVSTEARRDGTFDAPCPRTVTCPRCQGKGMGFPARVAHTTETKEEIDHLLIADEIPFSLPLLDALTALPHSGVRAPEQENTNYRGNAAGDRRMLGAYDCTSVLRRAESMAARFTSPAIEHAVRIEVLPLLFLLYRAGAVVVWVDPSELKHQALRIA